jgi:hypothetical protein
MANDKIEMPDRPYSVVALLSISGDNVIIGHNDDSVSIEFDGMEPIHASDVEIDMLIAALVVARDSRGL